MLLGKVPVGSVVRLLKTNEFAIITGKNQLQGREDSFLNYYCHKENHPDTDTYALYDADFEVEVWGEPDQKPE
jgi:hypothetical protein